MYNGVEFTNRLAMLPLLIEPADLLPHLDDPDLLVVDLCRDETYARTHIPGAVHISPAQLVSGVKPATGKLPEKARLEALFGSIGYQPSRPIVAYDDEGGGWAGRFLWTLDVIGHEPKSLLNGGLIAWLAEDLPVTADVPQVPATDCQLTLDRSWIAEKEDVLASINDPDTLIWDARSPEEYDGSRLAAMRGGHVPGAINLDWLETIDRNHQLRLQADLPGLLEARGLTPDKKIITHCQTHHRSGLTYFIGRLLGYDIRAYHGSWSEWGNDPDTPVET